MFTHSHYLSMQWKRNKEPSLILMTHTVASEQMFMNHILKRLSWLELLVIPNSSHFSDKNNKDIHWIHIHPGLDADDVIRWFKDTLTYSVYIMQYSESRKRNSLRNMLPTKATTLSTSTFQLSAFVKHNNLSWAWCFHHSDAT